MFMLVVLLFLFMHIFSSTEPKAQSGAYWIGVKPASVRPGQ